MKNKILKTIAGINIISFLFFGCMLDSSSWVPLIICCINMTWLGLFGYANGWFRERTDKWLKKNCLRTK